MTEDKKRQVNHLLDSLSGIDGDLLLDVEPARPVKPGFKVRSLVWRRWTAVAAGVLLLFVTGFIIRQVLLGGAASMDKAMAPQEEAFPESALSWPDREGDPEPGEVSTPPSIDLQLRDAGDIRILAARTATSVLLTGQADQIYSPAGLYWSLISVIDTSERGGDFDQAISNIQGHRFLSFSHALLPADQLTDECLESLLAGEYLSYGGICPQEAPPGLDPKDLFLVQQVEVHLQIESMVKVEEKSDGQAYAIIPLATILDEGPEGLIMARLPIEGGSLYLILPPPAQPIDEWLGQADLFSRLLTPWDQANQAGIRFPLFQIRTGHSWLPEELMEAVNSPDEGGMPAGLLQVTSFDWQSESRGDQEFPPYLIDFNRPFIFAIADQDDLFLLVGLVRSIFD